MTWKKRSTAAVIQTVALYSSLVLFALLFLMPMYVMLVNSVKPLSEIQAGGMMNLPQVWTIEPWQKAWSSAQVGVQATGLKPYFWNTIKMVVPAVAISTIMGALKSFGINQSSGGLMSATRAASYPVRTALSGPAAGD